MRYYSLVRPLDVGSVPKYSDNKTIRVVSRHVPVQTVWDMRGEIYGYVEYERPIPTSDVVAYDLVPGYKQYFHCLSVLYHNVLSSNPELYDKANLRLSYDESKGMYVEENGYSCIQADFVWSLFESKGVALPSSKGIIELSALLECPVWEFVRDYLEFDLGGDIHVACVLGDTLKGDYGQSIHSLFTRSCWSEESIPDRLIEDIHNPNLKLIPGAITKYCMDDKLELCRVSVSTKKKNRIRVDIIDEPNEYGVVDLINDIDNLFTFDVEDIYILSRYPEKMFVRKNVTSSDYIVVFV